LPNQSCLLRSFTAREPDHQYWRRKSGSLANRKPLHRCRHDSRPREVHGASSTELHGGLRPCLYKTEGRRRGNPAMEAQCAVASPILSSWPADSKPWASEPLSIFCAHLGLHPQRRQARPCTRPSSLPLLAAGPRTNVPCSNLASNSACALNIRSHELHLPRQAPFSKNCSNLDTSVSQSSTRSTPPLRNVVELRLGDATRNSTSPACPEHVNRAGQPWQPPWDSGR
jgi:hypothetical protein